MQRVSILRRPATVPRMSKLSYSLRDAVAWIQMDDGKANALGPDMIAELDEALDRALGEAKAVVLAGRPGRFCAGFDLKVMMGGEEAATSLLRTGAELLMKMYGFGLPLVAACTGHAVAGGALLLGASDVRIGVEGDFKLGLNETRIGMPLPIFVHTLATERLARRHLFAATLGATLYSPADAVEVGWLDETAPPEAMMDRAHAVATELAALAGQPFQLSKTSMRGAAIEHVRTTLEADLAATVSGLRFG